MTTNQQTLSSVSIEQKLVEIARLVELCSNSNNSTATVSTYSDAVKYLQEHCGGRIADIKAQGSFPEYDNADELYAALLELPLKKQAIPTQDLADTDLVYCMSGQAFTMAQNRLTFDQLRRHGLSKKASIYVSNHVYFGFPTLEQQQLCAKYVDADVPTNREDKIVDLLWNGKKNHVYVHYQPFRNAVENVANIKRLLSSMFPDRAQNVIIISTQPEQVAVEVQNQMPNTDHRIEQAYIVPDTKAEAEFISAYTGESLGSAIRFRLLDMVKVYCQ